ncbi:MAG: response regulator [Pseudomonadales bacterium]|nr:response regulator [Pseudomonadales bacterium]
MESNIKVGHPFYFPTQVVLLDDDPDFLEGVSLMLRRDLSYKLFQSAHSALEYVNSAHQQVQFLQRCYSSYKTGPAESDALSHIDINKIHLEVLNGARFQTCSTVIVDYSMPEMNGLEFLMSVKNPYIKKILLTGQADMELAVTAFNKQLIDQFIDKHDPRLKTRLNSAIACFQEQYFSSSYKLITDPILANNHDAFLIDADFQTFFKELRAKLQCVEYYMIDTPHAGFLMVDAKGEKSCLLVYTPDALATHYQALSRAKAPASLLRAVRDGKLLPSFDDQDSFSGAQDPRIRAWKDSYFPGYTIAAGRTFHTTIIPDEHLASVHQQSIIAYADFLQANCSINEVVH